MEVAELTRRLISVDSVSAHSNLPMLGALELRLVAAGFEVECLRWEDAHGIAKGTLIGRRGGKEGGLLLSGHSDTVPFRQDQKATLSAFQEADRLYGRGSCDMKGAIAAQLLAAESLKGRALKRPLTLAFTADEEIGCLGAKRLIGTNILRCEHAIIGEPTSLAPVRTHKGYIGLEVSLLGAACHSSAPRRGRSALKAGARALLALESIEAKLEGQGYLNQPGLFVPDCCTLNVGLFSGGVARNVVPEAARFTLEMRPLPGQSIQGLIEQVEGAIQEALAPSGVGHTVRVVTRDPPMETAADAEVVRFMSERSGAPAGAVSFSTEGKEFNQMGIQTVIFGPGSIDKAHQEDEYVPLDELEAAVDHYRAAIEYFCL